MVGAGSWIPSYSTPGHPWWTYPGAHAFQYLWDIMHGLDLGPTQHVEGNVLQDLVQMPALGPNMQARLSWVTSRIQWCAKQEAGRDHLIALP